MSVCKLCLLKTRPFPEDNEGMKERGDACRVCDRKFFIREMTAETNNQIECQDEVIKSLYK